MGSEPHSQGMDGYVRWARGGGGDVVGCLRFCGDGLQL